MMTPLFGTLWANAQNSALLLPMYKRSVSESNGTARVIV